MTCWPVAIASAMGLTWAQLWLVRHHPEPDPAEPDARHKPRYADLITRRVWLLAIPATLAALIPLAVLPDWRWPGWVVWSSAVAVLIWVDARSTWWPIRASRFAEWTMALAVVGAALLTEGNWWSPILGALLGASAAGAMFAIFWWLTGALGFGDVRLAALLGALTGMADLTSWSLSLLAGTLLALCWGLVTIAWRRYRPSPLGRTFAYGPGLWLGAHAGLAWTLLG